MADRHFTWYRTVSIFIRYAMRHFLSGMDAEQTIAITVLAAGPKPTAIAALYMHPEIIYTMCCTPSTITLRAAITDRGQLSLGPVHLEGLATMFARLIKRWLSVTLTGVPTNTGDGFALDIAVSGASIRGYSSALAAATLTKAVGDFLGIGYTVHVNAPCRVLANPGTPASVAGAFCA